MRNLWDNWNNTLEPQPYGLSDTYHIGAQWLAECTHIEDWGCGRGYMRTLIPPERYTGVDGSGTMADIHADLRTYRSNTPGLFMRHVLEHNHDWRDVLANAIGSFTERMVLVLFTPLQDETAVIGMEETLGVPDIAFAMSDLEPFFAGLNWTVETLVSEGTQYGVETVFLIGR